MDVYEIDQAIECLVDPDTGEILDFEFFESLQMDRNRKIENMALWFKNLTYESEALDKEEKALHERKRECKEKAENLKKHLLTILNGEKFSTPKVSVSFRTSTSVELDDGFLTWAMIEDETLLKYKEPEPDKTKIKEAIKNGKSFEFARLISKMNPQIK